jgi:hypothetical protein
MQLMALSEHRCVCATLRDRKHQALRQCTRLGFLPIRPLGGRPRDPDSPCCGPRPAACLSAQPKQPDLPRSEPDPPGLPVEMAECAQMAPMREVWRVQHSLWSVCRARSASGHLPGPADDPSMGLILEIKVCGTLYSTWNHRSGAAGTESASPPFHQFSPVRAPCLREWSISFG